VLYRTRLNQPPGRRRQPLRRQRERGAYYPGWSDLGIALG
jgi:hypothetical protein